MPAYTDELLYFNLKLVCADKKENPDSSIMDSSTGFELYSMGECFA
jgi:hypothetical protein